MKENQNEAENNSVDGVASTNDVLLYGLFCKKEVDEIHECAEKDKSKAFLSGWLWGIIATSMLMRWVSPLLG